MMLSSIQFKNFKALRDCTLPLSPFTLIIGPNGSGKTTALAALEAVARNRPLDRFATVGSAPSDEIAITLHWRNAGGAEVTTTHRRTGEPQWTGPTAAVQHCRDRLARFQLHALRPDAIAEPVTLAPHAELDRSGRGLAGVLDRLRDQHPERFTQLNEELRAWLPEFDRILFDTPDTGKRAVQLRTSEGGYAIPAVDLSDGTLTALALLTLAHLPDPPAILALEEPDHGIHTRLFREVRDALYRLAYPDQFDDPRPAVQVIATTHSPHMLDLFREHPEEVVISERSHGSARFTRLSERVDVDDILRDTSLGDAWYSGILGGVPDQP